MRPPLRECRRELAGGCGTTATGRRDGQAGFLYVEVLISLFIFATALLAVVPMFTLAAKENAAASDLTYASLVAQDLAEALKAVEFPDLASGSDTLKFRETTFTRSWVVTDDSPLPGMKRVTVTVTPQRAVRLGPNRQAVVSFFRDQ